MPGDIKEEGPKRNDAGAEKLCGLRALGLLDIDSFEDVMTPVGVSRSLVRLVIWILSDHSLQV